MSSSSTPLRVAILECDTPVPPVLEKVGTYGDIFTALLKNAAAAVQEDAKKEGKSEQIAVQTSTYDVVRDPDTYPKLDDIDAVLITGSSEFGCL